MSDMLEPVFGQKFLRYSTLIRNISNQLFYKKQLQGGTFLLQFMINDPEKRREMEPFAHNILMKEIKQNKSGTFSFQLI